MIAIRQGKAGYATHTTHGAVHFKAAGQAAKLTEHEPFELRRHTIGEQAGGATDSGVLYGLDRLTTAYTALVSRLLELALERPLGLR